MDQQLLCEREPLSELRLAEIEASLPEYKLGWLRDAIVPDLLIEIREQRAELARLRAEPILAGAAMVMIPPELPTPLVGRVNPENRAELEKALSEARTAGYHIVEDEPLTMILLAHGPVVQVDSRDVA